MEGGTAALFFAPMFFGDVKKNQFDFQKFIRTLINKNIGIYL
jgi:hypothetical protein